MNYNIMKLLVELKDTVESLDYWEGEWEKFHMHPQYYSEKLFEATSKVQSCKSELERIAKEIAEVIVDEN